MVREARRFRKMLGGGMRQAGVIAAAALFALEHHRSRLVEDHATARDVAAILENVRGAIVDRSGVETNIVNVGLSSADAERVVAAARAAGVLVNATGPRKLRVVTHLDAPRDRAIAGAERLARVIEACSGGP
jgi:threonine aldolase